MTPSKEAIEAFIKSYMDSFQGTILSPDECREIALNVAYAIDVVPLEQRVRELEAENQRLRERENIKPQMERKSAPPQSP